MTRTSASVAVVIVMLLLTGVTTLGTAMAATGKGVDKAPHLNVDNPAVGYSVREEHEEMLQIRNTQLERLKRMPKSPGLYVHVCEYYWYNLAPGKLIKERTPRMAVSLDLYNVKVDKVTIDLQLPVGITPEYTWGDIPEIYYNDATGELSLTYDTSDMTDEYIWTEFNLPELEVNPFVTIPAANATPSYCAPFEAKEITLSLSPAVLKEKYDYGRVELSLSGVETTKIVDVTPEADYEYDGDYSATAYWYYSDFDELPEHVMKVHVENDLDEVEVWYECNVEKYTGTNVGILNVTTSPTVPVSISSDTWIDSDVYFDLDPANYTLMHGFLEGTARTETGEVLSGARVLISGAGYHITKVTDENGRYRVMLPPWAYSVSAEYGYVAYDVEYESERYDVFVGQNTTTEQNLTLYKVPTVRMKISPIDDDLTDGKISYYITVENTGSRVESISLYGDDDVWNGTDYIWDVLEWTFSENYFDLDPEETRVVRVDAEFVGTEPLGWGRYAFEIYCYPESNGIQGYYYLKDFFEVHGVFDVAVNAHKDVYVIGEVIHLKMNITSYGGPYTIDFGIDVEYSGERWNYGRLTGLRYPADYTWTGEIPIPIPKSRLVPPGDYEFIVWIRDSATGQPLGEGSDTIRIEHGRARDLSNLGKFPFSSCSLPPIGRLFS